MFEQRVDMPNHAQWPINTLENLCEVISRGKGPRYVEASTVNAIGQRCITDQGFDPSLSRPHDDKVMSGHLIPAGGDVLLNSTGTGTIGRSSVFDGHGKFIVDSHVTLLRPLNKQVDSGWLNELLRNPRFQRHLEANCYTGSTNQLELSRSQLMKASVPTPSHDEQHLIARILDTLDTQIQKTEALIAKMEKVKEGLLHDLLTRGIDEDGQLRPSPEQAPELYKESPLGVIPREWSISSVGREFEIQLGKMLDAERNSGQMKPYLGNKAVQWGVIDIREVGQVRLTDSDVIKFRLVPGDLLVCEGGEIGRAALWEGQMDECYYQKALHRLRSKNNLSPRFMLQVLFLWGKRSTLSDYASQTSIAHLPKEKLEIVPVPVPSKHEQESIINVLQSHERTLKAESEALSEMHKIKSGLMDDLLTGRVRVTPLLDQAQATTPA
ncbi:restriction endonuclease subunit S [Salinicola sp. NYA28a]